MILYIDGDNSPNIRLEGIKMLSDKDEAIIYVNSGNGFFKKEKNLSILNEAPCEVSIKEVPQGDCAVDIAIAMAAAIRAEREDEGVVILISGDKHFNTIEKQLQVSYPKMIISKENSVIDAIKKYSILDVESLEDIKTALKKVYENGYGEKLFNRMSMIFEENHINLIEPPSIVMHDYVVRKRLSDLTGITWRSIIHR